MVVLLLLCCVVLCCVVLCCVVLCCVVLCCVVLCCVVLCCVVCYGVRGVVCLVWCLLCGTVENHHVSARNVPVCTFKTSPCVPAPRAHVETHSDYQNFVHIGLSRDPEVHQK